ncbi:hypothetical protein DPMN_104054 [Dreissena polymorpha]|uniref:Uncharacterized protein n=1 Tax=Dreissena polymorpha TaxID=45954 RepID=A0A9D4HC99_DREPO|nr:hypothetical protein DPMN_104054 [Dreissena polymorpha]
MDGTVLATLMNPELELPGAVYVTLTGQVLVCEFLYHTILPILQIINLVLFPVMLGTDK